MPVVVTIHDVSFIEQPEYLPEPRQCSSAWTRPPHHRPRGKVITISEFSRQRDRACLRARPRRHRRYAAGAHRIISRPVNREMARRMVADRLGIHRPFLLNVGDLHPRKNQIGLIQAFRELLDAHPELPHLLRAGGKHTWFAPKMLEEVKRYGLAGTGRASPGSSRTSSCRPSTTPPMFSCSRRSTKVLACRWWKPWLAAVRS